LITDGRTDRRTHARTGVTLNAPLPFFEWRGHKKEKYLVFRFQGNKVQYDFNIELEDTLKQDQRALENHNMAAQKQSESINPTRSPVTVMTKTKFTKQKVVPFA